MTARLRTVLDWLSRGPLTTPQVFACARVLLPDVMNRPTGRRLIFRALERLEGAGYLTHEPFPGERCHFWHLTDEGARMVAHEGIEVAPRALDLDRYRAWPHHERTVAHVRLAFRLGKHLQGQDGHPLWLDRLGWEEGVVIDLPDGMRIEPDAQVYLIGKGATPPSTFLIEVDRGTETLSGSAGWAGKVERYAQHAVQDGSCRVLVVATAPRRLRNLIRATRESDINMDGAFFAFALAADLSPESIARAVWTKVPGSESPVALPDLLRTERQP